MTITAAQAFDLAHHHNTAKDEARKEEANKIFRTIVTSIDIDISLIAKKGGYSACVTHMSDNELSVYESRVSHFINYSEHIRIPEIRLNMHLRTMLTEYYEGMGFTVDPEIITGDVADVDVGIRVGWFT